MYAARYSDDGFRRVNTGMNTTEVERILGEPLEQTWIYDGCAGIRVESNGASSYRYDACPWPSGAGPTPVAALVKLRGDPQRTIWDYAASPSDSSYHRRRVFFYQNRVQKKEASLYMD